jgi:uncharacterized protein (TIGR00255 family)
VQETIGSLAKIFLKGLKKESSQTMKSMTGFAQRDIQILGMSASILMKSYNNRYLDLSVFLSPSISSFEPTIIQMLSSKIRRGKIEFSLKLKNKGMRGTMNVDLELAKSLKEALVFIAEGLEIPFSISLSDIALYENVISRESELNLEEIWKEIEPHISASIADFEEARKREGKATEVNIEYEMKKLEKNLVRVQTSVVEIDSTIKQQLASKFSELLPNNFDEQRLLQEVAVQLVRFGINEEVSRLIAHIQAFKEISREESPAKKLDFLCQEMNREINTIGSKNMLVSVAHAVVEMKDSLENIREQLRNVE